MSTSAADTPGQVVPGSGRTWVVPGYTELLILGGGGFGSEDGEQPARRRPGHADARAY